MTIFYIKTYAPSNARNAVLSARKKQSFFPSNGTAFLVSLPVAGIGPSLLYFSIYFDLLVSCIPVNLDTPSRDAIFPALSGFPDFLLLQ